MSLQPITAAGGVLYVIQDDEAWVLLIKRMGVWDLPKGKCDEGETVSECARREVMEEVGIRSAHLGSELGITEHSYDENGISYLKTTYWYAMTTDDEEMSPQTSEAITELGWFPLIDAERLVGYDNLRIVLKRFKETWLKNAL